MKFFRELTLCISIRVTKKDIATDEVEPGQRSPSSINISSDYLPRQIYEGCSPRVGHDTLLQDILMGDARSEPNERLLRETTTYDSVSDTRGRSRSAESKSEGMSTPNKNCSNISRTSCLISFGSTRSHWQR